MVGQQNADRRPQLTCVAANGYVIQKGQPLKNGEAPRKKIISSGYDKLDPNEWSLGFLLTLGNFRYYAGGDLTSVQESGNKWDSKAKDYKDIIDPTEDKKGTISYPDLSLMKYLGRVDAMKTSHHGSRASSSPTFINTVQPRAAIISCGSNNVFCHPHQEVVDTLEESTAIRAYFLTGFFTPGFTSKKYNIPWLGKKANVAGVWISSTSTQLYEIEKEGDIVLSIDENGAQKGPATFDVHYYMPKPLLTPPPPQDPEKDPEEDLQAPQMGKDNKDTHWQTKSFA